MKARYAAFFAITALTATACADGNLFAPQEDFSTPEALQSLNYGATLLECPSPASRSARGVIGARGGVLELGGHRMVVPALAVLSPTSFTLTEPVSNHMEVTVTAGDDRHYRFRHPVEISISYERCNRANTDKRQLRIYYVDPATRTILEDMGGVDDKVNRRVTVRTDHLSGYSVGDNRGGDGPAAD